MRLQEDCQAWKACHRCVCNWWISATTLHLWFRGKDWIQFSQQTQMVWRAWEDLAALIGLRLQVSIPCNLRDQWTILFQQLLCWTCDTAVVSQLSKHAGFDQITGKLLCGPISLSWFWPWSNDCKLGKRYKACRVPWNGLVNSNGTSQYYECSPRDGCSVWSIQICNICLMWNQFGPNDCTQGVCRM